MQQMQNHTDCINVASFPLKILYKFILKYLQENKIILTCLWESLKYAGTVMTAFLTDVPK